jgi:hypothetical protein
LQSSARKNRHVERKQLLSFDMNALAGPSSSEQASSRSISLVEIRAYGASTIRSSVNIDNGYGAACAALRILRAMEASQKIT